MKVLVLLSSLVCCGLCSSQLQLQEEWSSWKRQHAKTYSSNNDEDSKWTVWRENYHKIQEHNRANHSFSLGLNEFADMTQEEFASFYLSTPKDMAEFRKNRFLYEESDEDAEKTAEGTDNTDSDSGGMYTGGIDWRKKGYVTKVKNQGQCGSCWAFSATGALEGQFYHSKGSLVSLSEQQLVDCSWNYGNAGCHGGLMNYAFKYVKNNGICSSSAYPYVGYDNKWNCLSNKCSSVGYTKGYTDVTGENNLAKAVANKGPISVAIDASSYQFQFYSSGVYLDSSCSSSSLNHGVLVVGYGSYNNDYYWIVKNSWGTSWGSSGYVFMAKGQNNMCGIASAASYPTVK